jgi:hypothetical protein
MPRNINENHVLKSSFSIVITMLGMPSRFQKYFSMVELPTLADICLSLYQKYCMGRHTVMINPLKPNGNYIL